MRRFRAWGWSAALTAVACATVGIAADLPSGKEPQKPWYNRMFGRSDKPAPSAESPAPSAVGPLAPEALTEALRAEQQAYSRRMEFCTKLREVAAQTNDDALWKRADSLEEQAQALYFARTARIGVKGKGPGGLPPADSLAERTSTPQDAIGRKLGPTADPLTVARPVNVGSPATAELRRFREVQQP